MLPLWRYIQSCWRCCCVCQVSKKKLPVMLVVYPVTGRKQWGIGSVSSSTYGWIRRLFVILSVCCGHCVEGLTKTTGSLKRSRQVPAEWETDIAPLSIEGQKNMYLRWGKGTLLAGYNTLHYMYSRHTDNTTHTPITSHAPYCNLSSINVCSLSEGLALKMFCNRILVYTTPWCQCSKITRTLSQWTC